MGASFDHMAAGYDAHFTHSPTGLLQRQVVWQYLHQILPQQRALRILELNSGTGEDALRLAQKGHQVLATDISPNMLDVAQEKLLRAGLQDRVTFREMAIKALDPRDFNQHFDWVFSNFGGLNCIGPEQLGLLAASLTAITKQRGRAIFIAMPTFCLWETAYFLWKKKWTQAFRRRGKRPVEVRFNGSSFPVWYYSPGQLLRIFAAHGWQMRRLLPVGIALPPSYLATFFADKPKALGRLQHWEARLGAIPRLAHLADHYLIDLELIR